MPAYFELVTAPDDYHVFVRPESSGGYTAGVIGLPEIRSTAPTELEALQAVMDAMLQWLTTTKWLRLRVWQGERAVHPGAAFPGRIDPNDPVEKMHLEELARLRGEDLNRTLREQEQECPNTSSSPTT
jgi:hypothetical protein